MLTNNFCIAFLIVKVIEWTVEIDKGYTITSNNFLCFYYFLTGIHLLQLLVGFLFLGIVPYQLKSPARRSQTLVETGATYWHMVDFLWLNIFALLVLSLPETIWWVLI